MCEYARECVSILENMAIIMRDIRFIRRNIKRLPNHIRIIRFLISLNLLAIEGYQYKNYIIIEILII